MQSGDERLREVSLARFCVIYYPSIYGFARVMGFTVDDAKDRVQDFFVKVVEERLLQKYSPQKNTRLSSWLIKCFKNQVLHHLEAQGAKRRGGGVSFVELDSLYAEARFLNATAAGGDPAAAFDLTLAQELWVRAQALLTAKHRGRRSEKLAEALIPMILHSRWPGPPAPSQGEVAQLCGVTSSTLKAFYHHTLRRQARTCFDLVAAEHCQKIAAEELDQLWEILKANVAC
jgi:DNA-directed RNA polymerase specialized sigma24 family protein